MHALSKGASRFSLPEKWSQIFWFSEKNLLILKSIANSSMFKHCVGHMAFGSYQASRLPRWLSGKESFCQAGDPGLIPGEGNGNPLQYSCLEIPQTEEPGGLQFTGLHESGMTWWRNNKEDSLPSLPYSRLGFWKASPTPQFKSINSSVLSLLHSPTFTSIHDHRKNHGFLSASKPPVWPMLPL